MRARALVLALALLAQLLVPSATRAVGQGAASGRQDGASRQRQLQESASPSPRSGQRQLLGEASRQQQQRQDGTVRQLQDGAQRQRQLEDGEQRQRQLQDGPQRQRQLRDAASLSPRSPRCPAPSQPKYRPGPWEKSDPLRWVGS